MKEDNEDLDFDLDLPKKYKNTWADMVSQSVFFANVAGHKVKERTCLRCRKMFKSCGPQNRMCEDCKTWTMDRLDQYD